jgi:hypothetical protein
MSTVVLWRGLRARHYLSAEAEAGNFSTGFFCKVAATKWFPSMEPFPALHVLGWLSEIKRCDMS